MFQKSITLALLFGVMICAPSFALTKTTEGVYEFTAEEVVDLNNMRKQLEDECEHWKGKYELAEAELVRREESEIRKDKLQEDLIINLQAQIALYKSNEDLYNKRIDGKDDQIRTLKSSRTFQNIMYGLLGVGIGRVIN